MNTGGFSKERLARLHDIMAGYVERGEISGIVTAVSRRGEAVIDAIGMKAAGGRDPVRRDDIASVPGRFGWDGGMGTSWYPDLQEEMVTILMTQRSWTSPNPPDVCLDFWTLAYSAIDD